MQSFAKGRIAANLTKFKRLNILIAMYCSGCGCNNSDNDYFCRKCGKPLAATESEMLQKCQMGKGVSDLLNIDPKSNTCHKCGAEIELTRHEFAMAKVTAIKRNWGETAALAGISALSIATAPLTGFIALKWKNPDKTVSFNLIRATLVLCLPCLSGAWKTKHKTSLKEEALCLHPWVRAARGLGYDKFLSAEEIARLRPVR